MTEHIDCPRCETTNDVPEEYIGRYYTCPRCRCRYYVPVPNPVPARARRSSSGRAPSNRRRSTTSCETVKKVKGQFCGCCASSSGRPRRCCGTLHLARWLLATFVVASVVELAVLITLLQGR